MFRCTEGHFPRILVITNYTVAARLKQKSNKYCRLTSPLLWLFSSTLCPSLISMVVEDVPHLVVARGSRLTEAGHGLYSALEAYGLLLMSSSLLGFCPLPRRIKGGHHGNVLCGPHHSKMLVSAKKPTC